MLMYLILGTQFRSYTQPLIILGTVPFAFIGAMVGLLISGDKFGIVTLFGVVALAGIVVNDAIVLISFINDARRAGGDVATLDNPWGQVFTVDQIQTALAERPAQVVAIVHGETSTGACQPIEGLADVVHAQGGVLIVDTVASLGGVPFKVDELGVDVCYTGSQKCLSCPPGLAPITLISLFDIKLDCLTFF